MKKNYTEALQKTKDKGKILKADREKNTFLLGEQ